ncbi:hypothetical protein P7K49_012015, partial [Saguinus oedipus]
MTNNNLSDRPEVAPPALEPDTGTSFPKCPIDPGAVTAATQKLLQHAHAFLL